MKIRILLFFSLLITGLTTQISLGQSNPVPHDLNTSNYTFIGFSAGDITTYPASMQGHSFSSERVLSNITENANSDRELVNSISSTGTGSIRNEISNGISLLSSTNNHIGAIVVAVNTIGRTSINVSWIAQQLNSGGEGSNDRVNGLRLQYRIGTTGSFVDVASTEYLTTNTNSVNPFQLFENISLPSIVENEAIVHLRWIYYISSGSSNARDRIRLDDITISSSPLITNYTLTYNGNGNTGGAAPLATSYAEGATVVLPDAGTLVRTGYTFGGWNTEASGTGTNYNAGANYTMPAANTTLYAKWECPLTPNGTIEFMADPSCNSNTWLTYQHGMNQPQGGVTYFWQTSLTGEDTNFPANAPYLAIANGQDYYVRAFNGECWSTGALQIQNPLIFNPVIASISPLSGAPVGTEITITLVGNYFTTNNEYLVDFGSEIVIGTAISATQLKVTIPEGATGGFALETNLSCDIVSDYTVIVKDNSGCN